VVATSQGKVLTDTVVNTAGHWSPKLADMVGVKLPIEPRKGELFVTEPILNVYVAGDITGVGGKDLSKLQGQVAGLNILGNWVIFRRQRPNCGCRHWNRSLTARCGLST